jgi:hypothetical protein
MSLSFFPSQNMAADLTVLVILLAKLSKSLTKLYGTNKQMIYLFFFGKKKVTH